MRDELGWLQTSTTTFWGRDPKSTRRRISSSPCQVSECHVDQWHGECHEWLPSEVVHCNMELAWASRREYAHFRHTIDQHRRVERPSPLSPHHHTALLTRRTRPPSTVLSHQDSLCRSACSGQRIETLARDIDYHLRNSTFPAVDNEACPRTLLRLVRGSMPEVGRRIDDDCRLEGSWESSWVLGVWAWCLGDTLRVSGRY